jgi:methyl-accepting chemotaxis protein
MEIGMLTIAKSLTRQGGASDRGMIDAINKSQAVIEFAMDGKILQANENFLKAMG